MATGDILSYAFSFYGMVYVIVFKFLTGELTSLDQLWEPPSRNGQQSLVLPWFLGNTHSLSFETSSELKTPLDRNLDSLQLFMEYFSDTVEMNPLLDVFVNIHLIEQNLRVLNISDDSRRLRLENIMNLAVDIVKRGEEVFKLDQPEYYAQLGAAFRLEGFGLKIESRMLPNVTHDASLTQPDEYSELVGNLCMAQGLNCSMSEDCWRMMTVPHQSGYTLTHQVLYMILIQSQCKDSARSQELMAAFNQNSFVEINDRLCADVHYETGQIVSQNYPETRRDLFCEQLFFCGMLGYPQFFTPDSLEAILSWQSLNGCYKYQSNAIFLTFLLNKLGKRMEILRDDMCFPHLSSLCGGAMAMYVRYLNEDPDLIKGSFK